MLSLLIVRFILTIRGTNTIELFGDFLRKIAICLTCQIQDTFVPKNGIEKLKIPKNKNFDKDLDIFIRTNNENYVVVNVSETTLRKAREKAYVQYTRLLNYLSLYNSKADIIDSSSYRITSTLSWTSKKYFGLAWKRNESHDFIEIDEKLEECLELINLDKESNLNTAIHSSMLYYRKGNSAFNYGEKLLNYFISIETLLTTKEDITSKDRKKLIAERMSVILGSFEEYIIENLELTYCLGGIRDSIVHGGKSDVIEYKKEIDKLQIKIRYILNVLIDCSIKGSKTLKDAIKRINLLKIKRYEKCKASLKKNKIEIAKQYVCEGKLTNQFNHDLGEVKFRYEVIDDGKIIHQRGMIITHKRPKGAFTTRNDYKYSIDGIISDGRKIKIKKITDLEIINMLMMFGITQLPNGMYPYFEIWETNFLDEEVSI